MWNPQLQWKEQENGTDKKSEFAKNLIENDNHEFKWAVLPLTPKFSFKRKILGQQERQIQSQNIYIAATLLT